MDKFNIYSAKRSGNEITNEMYAGSAIYLDEGYYKMRLSIFPNITYFMRRNQKTDKFTIFSRLRGKGKDLKFFDPVGHGLIDQNLKAHMLLRFEVLKANLYMSLFPEGMCA